MTLPHGHDAPRSELLMQQLHEIYNLVHKLLYVDSITDSCDTLARIRLLAFEARREIHNIWDRACEPEGIDLKELGL
jgi:hypothetical protein